LHTAPAPTSTLPPSLHDALPISRSRQLCSSPPWHVNTLPTPCAQYPTTSSTATPTVSTQPESAWNAYESLSTSTPSVLAHGKSKDRKSTRLNSSHVSISYAVFCL